MLNILYLERPAKFKPVKSLDADPKSVIKELKRAK